MGLSQPVGSSLGAPSLSAAASPVGSHRAWHLTRSISASASSARSTTKRSCRAVISASVIGPSSSPECAKWREYFLKKFWGMG